MDKSKVIAAYMRGFITLKECEQILGMDSSFILGMARDWRNKENENRTLVRQPANR